MKALLLTLIALSALTVHLNAQAYCALRDPNAAIQTLFPSSTSSRSNVRTVNESTRASVQNKLPPNTLHRGELGRHTLYIVKQGPKTIGFVHARSEKSRWGLVEIAWAIDPQMRIVDFYFQRCRSNQRIHLESQAFRSTLQGRNLEQLKELLAPDGQSFDPSKAPIPPQAQELASVVLRCALKTILVTQLTWPDEVTAAQNTLPNQFASNS